MVDQPGEPFQYLKGLRKRLEGYFGQEPVVIGHKKNGLKLKVGRFR